MTLDGETTLAELEEDFGFNFKSEGVTTLAGLILASTGTIPNEGETVEVQGHELSVVDVDNHKITQVRVTRTAAPTPEPEAPADDHH